MPETSGLSRWPQRGLRGRISVRESTSLVSSSLVMETKCVMEPKLHQRFSVKFKDKYLGHAVVETRQSSTYSVSAW